MTVRILFFTRELVLTNSQLLYFFVYVNLSMNSFLFCFPSLVADLGGSPRSRKRVQRYGLFPNCQTFYGEKLKILQNLYKTQRLHIIKKALLLSNLANVPFTTRFSQIRKTFSESSDRKKHATYAKDTNHYADKSLKSDFQGTG